MSSTTDKAPNHFVPYPHWPALRLDGSTPRTQDAAALDTMPWRPAAPLLLASHALIASIGIFLIVAGVLS